MKPKYKVVKRRSRMSAMVNGNSKYARQYLADTTVHAHGETVGIMVFHTFHQAKSWIEPWNMSSDKDLAIIKVMPIGRGKRVSWLSGGVATEDIEQFYTEASQMGHNSPWILPPAGTMAYPGVYVME